MKARIIETQPVRLPLDFNGKTYYTSLSVGVAAEIAEKYEGGISHALENINRFSVAADVIAALINNAIKISNFENEENERLVTGEYISAVTHPDCFATLVNQVMKIVIGSMPKTDLVGTEVTGEDEDIDDSDIPAIEEKN